MSIFNQFPWTNYREYNLDWVIRTVTNALADLSSTVATYFSDHVDNTLTVAGDAADAKKTGDEISSLSGRLTTVEGYESRIAALEALQPKRVILRYNGSNWSYGTGDFAAVDSIATGMIAPGTPPSLDLLGSIVYQPTLSSPALTLHSVNFNASYGAGKPAYDLTFDGGNVSVTVKWDGTFA